MFIVSLSFILMALIFTFFFSDMEVHPGVEI
jgi:hypothetical protein